MRLVVQRVKSASVTVAVDGGPPSIVSSIGPGALALVGLHENDTVEDLEYCRKKLLGCKLWPNNAGAPWRHGVKQKGYELLCVSQFTLYGKLTKKNQPDYKASMKSVPAKAMYERFLDMLKSEYGDRPDKIKDGVFGAMMDVGELCCVLCFVLFVVCVHVILFFGLVLSKNKPVPFFRRRINFLPFRFVSELVNDGPVTIVIDSFDFHTNNNNNKKPPPAASTASSALSSSAASSGTGAAGTEPETENDEKSRIINK